MHNLDKAKNTLKKTMQVRAGHPSDLFANNFINLSVLVLFNCAG